MTLACISTAIQSSITDGDEAEREREIEREREKERERERERERESKRERETKRKRVKENVTFERRRSWGAPRF